MDLQVMSTPKRKKVVVSMYQKLEALQRLEKGVTLQHIAEMYGVGRNTVFDWKKKRTEIEEWCSSRASSGCNKRRKTMKKGEYAKVSEALFLWFREQREQGAAITGPMLQQKALEFQKEFKEGPASFTASSGWLERWKQRYGVRQSKIRGEKLATETIFILEEPQPEPDELDISIKEENLSMDPISSTCDETDLHYKVSECDETPMLEATSGEVAKITHKEGLEAIELALKYVEQQEEATITDTLLFNRWREYAEKKTRDEEIDQLSITHFLCK